MLITSATIAALQVTFSQIFRSAWGETPTWGERLATTVPSSTASNSYGWMARIQKVREWLGPRVLQNLSTHSYTLANKSYEDTVGVDRDDIEDDNLGVYNPLMAELARAGRKWPDQLLKTLLQSGTSALGFDGVAFFAATHPLNPAANQTNNFTTSALSSTNYNIVSAAMRSFVGEDGEPLGIEPNLLVVPPQLRDEGKEILVAERLASGATNTNRGDAELLVIPELANEATTWYLFDTTRPIKALIFQLRRAMQLTSMTNLNDANVFFQKQFVWGIDGRGNAGFGPWFLAARSIA